MALDPKDIADAIAKAPDNVKQSLADSLFAFSSSGRKASSMTQLDALTAAVKRATAAAQALIEDAKKQLAKDPAALLPSPDELAKAFAAALTQ